MTLLEYESDNRKIQLELNPDTEYGIGRDPDCRIRLEDRSEISHRHCVIGFNRRFNSFALTDLDSIGGTFLNGQKIGQNVPLHDGDRIQAGSVEFVFHQETSTSTRKIVPSDSLPVARPETFASVPPPKSGPSRFRKQDRLLSGEIVEDTLPDGEHTENYLLRAPDGTLRMLSVLREIPSDRAAGPELIRLTEALPRLPGLPPVFRCGAFEDGICFRITEYREAPSYARMISQLAPLSQPRALALVYMAAVILARGKEHGVFHGALKPADILYIPREGNFITGTGLAAWRSRFFPDWRKLPGQWYAAPETTAGNSVWQSDQYALGIMLFQLLTGVLPFYAETADELADLHARSTMPLPPERNAHVKVLPAVNAILLRMTMKRPGDRYESWEALLADLERVNSALKRKTAGIHPENHTKGI